MGNSKYFLLGQQNRGTSNYRDFSKQSATPSRPRPGIIRTWIDSAGILNLMADTGAALKAIFGTQSDYNDAIAKKHANTLDHAQNSDGGLATGTVNEVTAVQLKKIVSAIQANPVTQTVMAGLGATGQLNVIAGNNNFVCGKANTLAGECNFVSGDHNTMADEYACRNAVTGSNNSIGLGGDNLVGGSNHQVLGSCNSVTGFTNSCEGDMNHVEGGNNTLVGGFYNHQEGEGHVNAEGWLYGHQEGAASKAYNHLQHLRGGGMFTDGTPGDAQYSTIIAKAITSSEDPIPLTADSNGNLIWLPVNKLCTFRVLVVASTADLASGASYEFKGLISQGAAQGTATILGTVNKTVMAETDPTWDCNVTADNTNGALQISATGAAATTIRWVAFVEMIEVSF